MTNIHIMEQRLRDCEARLQVIFKSSPDGLFIFDPHGRCIDANPAGCEMTGTTLEQILSECRRPYELIEETGKAVSIPVTSGDQPAVYRLDTPDGRVVWVERTCLPLYLSRGRFSLEVLHDVSRAVCAEQALAKAISALREHEERYMLAASGTLGGVMQVDHDALHDALTGLPNQALFLDRLEHALQRCHRLKDPSECFAVLYLDLDRFQIINNSLGHAAGNEVLIAVAQLLRTCLRDGDTVARLAGDEFTILLENVSGAESARVIADRILESMQTHHLPVRGSQVFVSASIGMVVTKAEYGSADEILRDASIAKHVAKSQGRGRSVLFTPEMREGVIARLELETDLRLALEHQEFFLVYQPILSLTNGKISGLEALLRWKHPRYGILSPQRFLSIAEETGLIVPIGRWVLKNACQQLSVWQAGIPEARDLTVSVNISSLQIHQPDFIEQVDEVLRGSGLDPAYLRLEITETILLERSKSTLNAIDALRRRGIQLHIDDFGTGYSALSYVHNFSIDTVKIDRSFIERIGEPGSNLDVIRSILKFAASLGLSTVAEGIETAEQLREIQALPCSYGQGYYISRPLDVEKVESLLASGLKIPLSPTIKAL